jgi:hypothetical protein
MTHLMHGQQSHAVRAAPINSNTAIMVRLVCADYLLKQKKTGWAEQIE